MRQASLSIVPLRNTKCECACCLLYKCTSKAIYVHDTLLMWVIIFLYSAGGYSAEEPDDKQHQSGMDCC